MLIVKEIVYLGLVDSVFLHIDRLMLILKDFYILIG